MNTTRISQALRERVAETAHFRCGYCLTSQKVIGPLLEIEHYIPEAQGGTSSEENLWLACPICNSHKSDRVAAPDSESGAIVAIFNPRVDVWRDHFVWIEGDTVIQGITPVGRATVAALHMNHPEVVAVRRLWVSVGWHPPDEI